MSQLDFSEKIELRSMDELGMLSEIFNRLSENLSDTINRLDDTNTKLTIELQKEKKLEKMRRQQRAGGHL